MLGFYQLGVLRSPHDFAIDRRFRLVGGVCAPGAITNALGGLP